MYHHIFDCLYFSFDSIHNCVIQPFFIVLFFIMLYFWMERLPLSEVNLPILFLLYPDVSRVRSCECGRIHEDVIPSSPHLCDPSNARSYDVPVASSPFLSLFSSSNGRRTWLWGWSASINKWLVTDSFI